MSSSSGGGDDPPTRGSRRTLPPPHRSTGPAQAGPPAATTLTGLPLPMDPVEPVPSAAPIAAPIPETSGPATAPHVYQGSPSGPATAPHQYASHELAPSPRETMAGSPIERPRAPSIPPPSLPTDAAFDPHTGAPIVRAPVPRTTQSGSPIERPRPPSTPPAPTPEPAAIARPAFLATSPVTQPATPSALQGAAPDESGPFPGVPADAAFDPHTGAPIAPPVSAPHGPSTQQGVPAAPYGSGPVQGVPNYQSGATSAPWSGVAPAPPPEASSIWDVADNLPGSPFVKFLKISARRAFRLRIEPSEVLPSERRALMSASPPILEASLQAFLAWRRSVLFLVACALVPLTIIGIGDSLRHTDYQAIFFVKFAPAFAELIFCLVCWQQLKRWANWRQQRRKLFWGWLIFMITPFIVFIYPLNTFFSEIRGAASSAEKRMALLALGVDGVYRQAVMPFVFAMIAMLQLAPKAISLMPGLIRSSMVIKLLFPGVSAPGWLIVMASPLYALLAYVILIIPYQFTGSGWFIAGVLGVVVGQALLARAGFRLARPMTENEALDQIKKVRRYYMTVMITSGVLIIVALGSLVTKLNLRATDVILAVLKFESNVLILTMIGADLVITNLDMARGNTAGRDHVEDEAESKIAAFVSLEHTSPSNAPPP